MNASGRITRSTCFHVTGAAMAAISDGVQYYTLRTRLRPSAPAIGTYVFLIQYDDWGRGVEPATRAGPDTAHDQMKLGTGRVAAISQ